MGNKRIGSSFDDLLKRTAFVKMLRIRASSVSEPGGFREEMKARHINKNKMAELTKTSRSQLDRFLDPENTKVQLDTMQRAETAVGCQLVTSLEPAAR